MLEVDSLNKPLLSLFASPNAFKCPARKVRCWSLCYNICIHFRLCKCLDAKLGEIVQDGKYLLQDVEISGQQVVTKQEV